MQRSRIPVDRILPLCEPFEIVQRRAPHPPAAAGKCPIEEALGWALQGLTGAHCDHRSQLALHALIGHPERLNSCGRGLYRLTRRIPLSDADASRYRVNRRIEQLRKVEFSRRPLPWVWGPECAAHAPVARSRRPGSASACCSPLWLCPRTGASRAASWRRSCGATLPTRRRSTICVPACGAAQGAGRQRAMRHRPRGRGHRARCRGVRG